MGGASGAGPASSLWPLRVSRRRWETEIQIGESRVPHPSRMEFVKCLGHPEEFYNLLRFRMGGQRKFIPKMDQVGRASLYPRGSVAAARTRVNGEQPRAPRSPWKEGGSWSGSHTPAGPYSLDRSRPTPYLFLKVSACSSHYFSCALFSPKLEGLFLLQRLRSKIEIRENRLEKI